MPIPKCPHCGGDLSAPKRLVAVSARDLVESLRLDADLLSWCARRAPNIEPVAELENFLIRMRMNGYKTNQGAVKDARAAFQYHMIQAVKYAPRGTVQSKPVRPVPPKKEL